MIAVELKRLSGLKNLNSLHAVKMPFENRPQIKRQRYNRLW